MIPAEGTGLRPRARRALDKNTIDPMPGSVVAPAIEVTLHCRARWKILRQCAPLAAGRSNVKQRVHDRAQNNLAPAPEPTRFGHERGDQSPLSIIRVASVAKAVPSILLAGDFSPRHGAAPS